VNNKAGIGISPLGTHKHRAWIVKAKCNAPILMEMKQARSSEIASLYTKPACPYTAILKLGTWTCNYYKNLIMDSQRMF